MPVTTAGTAAELSAATVDYMENVAIDQEHRDNITWHMFVEKKGGIKKLKKGSISMTKPIIVGDLDDVIEEYDPDNATLNLDRKDIHDKARFYWKYTSAQLAYNKRDVVENQDSEEKRVDVIQSKGRALARGIRRRIVCQIYGVRKWSEIGSGATAATITNATDGEIASGDPNSLRIMGLPVICATTGNYGLLDRAVVTEFAPDSNSIVTWNNTADITIAQIMNWVTYCTDGRTKGKYMAMRPPLWGYIQKLLYPSVEAPHDAELRKVGFPNFEVYGIPAVADWHVPNGRSYIIDTDPEVGLELIFHPNNAISKGEFYYVQGQKKWVQEFDVVLSLQAKKLIHTHGMASGNGLLDSNITAAM